MNTEKDYMLQQHLEEAERHVERGKKLLQKQCEILDRLKRDGHDTSVATDMLHMLEQSQMTHIADRDRIREQLTQSTSDVQRRRIRYADLSRVPRL